MGHTKFTRQASRGTATGSYGHRTLAGPGRTLWLLGHGEVGELRELGEEGEEGEHLLCVGGGGLCHYVHDQHKNTVLAENQPCLRHYKYPINGSYRYCYIIY